MQSVSNLNKDKLAVLNKGYFLISLDFELQWGRFDKVALTDKRKQELENTIEVIPKFLKLFETYNVAATWATVGMLFNKNSDQWKCNIPKTIPNYTNSKYSPYLYFNSLKEDDKIENYFYALDIINMIVQASSQEMASHTYSHFYCFEKGQTVNNFADDLMKAKSVMEYHKCNFDSLVFPRNQYNEEYYKTCTIFGLQTIRTNPIKWYWNTKNKDTKLKKIFRLVDIFNFLDYSNCIDTSAFLRQKTKPYKLPSSRFFRSWIPNRLVNYLKLKRILLEMSYAAKHKKYYHLWWHPENFGTYPDQCLQELEVILKHYSFLNCKYNFKSESMSSFSKIIQLNK
jgi:peptidoglycan/xylan/chitin deacetylase (PgdA/CDA1 family)